jgi:hypothetical protein
MTSPAPDRRTAWITAAGIVAVVVGGAFAVSANLGILSASSADQVGALTATDDLAPATSESIVPPPAPMTPPATQSFIVDSAGSVSIANMDPLVVRGVSVNPGWASSDTSSTGTRIDIVFSNTVRTLVFHAARNDEGQITATVDEISGRQPPGADAASTPTPGHNADEDEEYDEHVEHEGRDDDD